MTVIAWDGKTLAADKRASANGLILTVTKIRRINKALYGCAGSMSGAQEMFAWVENGCDPKELPAFQRTDDYVAMLMVGADRIAYRYDCGPFPLKLEDKFTAIGSGRDFAIAAMHLGCDARHAVEVASIFETSCGNGVDELSL